ncbi:S5A-REDUCTASE domain-containing protein [Mycena chlorophos]|uniref:S5A-REDUCTASE domain-containing protein n=1 Tax=Mycena chlorophos TaxID=658473 RepID=A0A8H6WNA9_MYCCL|nr:S5A-REDUCTASE domain-containing protein [Mycena chlorophos]
MKRSIQLAAQSVPGVAIFAVGRLSDAPLQYLLFSKGWAVKALTSVGIRASNLLVTTGPGLGGIGPIPTLLTGMYAVASLRHAYWVLVTNTYHWEAGGALGVVAFNSVMNLYNTLVATNALTSSSLPLLGTFTDCIGWKQWAGLGIFGAGILLEMAAEEARRAFKKDERNKGKICNVGPWGMVRHPNYLGYLLWRVGITLATGSLPATIIMGAFQAMAFIRGGIPDLVAHMKPRYGVQWEEYEKQVPYALIPGIY